MTATYSPAREPGRIAAALRAVGLDRMVADEVARQMKSGATDHEFTLDVLLGGRIRGNRLLTRDGYNRLLRQIKALTSAGAPDRHVCDAYRILLDAETRGLGRIAGSTYNILGKLVAPGQLPLPPGDVLEIGTLYGLFSASLIRCLRRAGQFRDLTVVDPFAGLQIQGGENLRADRSGTPVSERVARQNFRELGLVDEDVRVIVGLSTDPTVQARAGDRAYALVVVDGDHFEDGVARDLRWVEEILAPGGIAVLDDYGDAKWPGVQAATTKYLETGGRMSLLGTIASSAYLRMPG